MTSISEYPSYVELEKKLWRVNDHWRVFRVLEGLVHFAAILVGALFLFCLLEGIFHFTFWVRLLMLLAMIIVAAGGLAYFVFRPILSATSLAQVARHVENKYPELDNGLINALLLAEDDRVPEPYFVARLADEVVQKSRDVDFGASIDKKRFERLSLSCAVCVALLLGYMFLFPARFTNALFRILRPGANIAAVGNVVIKETEPGDTEIVSGSDLAVSVTVERAPLKDLGAKLFYRFEDTEQEEIRTLYLGEQFTYKATVPEVKIPLTYYVSLGSTISKKYKVDVLPKPLVTRIDLTYHYPDYTKLPDVTLENCDGNIKAPIGTRVTIMAEANRPVQASNLVLNDTETKRVIVEEDGIHVSAKLYVKESGTYFIQIVDSKNYVNTDPIKHTIEAVPDMAPLIEIPVPGKEVTLAPGEKLEMVAKVSDDYGIAKAVLYHQINDGAAEAVKTWDSLEEKSTNLLYQYQIPKEKVKTGDTITYWAAATDTCAMPEPQTSESLQYVIRIMDIEKILEDEAKELDKWIAKLQKILEIQKRARAASGKLGVEVSIKSFQRAVTAIKPDQVKVRTETIKLAEEMTSGSLQIQKVRKLLVKLSRNQMAACIKTLEGLRMLEDLVYKEEPLVKLIKDQDKIIEILEALLSYMPKLKEKILNPEEGEDPFDLPMDAREALLKLDEDAKKFLDTQKKIIEASKDLLKLPVDDWTEEQEKKLDELKVKEDDLAKLLNEDYSDFSRIPEQDFSDPSLLKELIEVISAIEKASDALSRRNMELAVPYEQLGVENAEELTTHIEKWLPDSADRERWTQEEPFEQYETEMPELPEQLEDLIGELMEEEDELFEEVEDVTSSWADSIDKGAGWDALDGPISNMSAQGVTGNRLPNTSEIGGRSGEGRTGKAHGEMVGDTAIGKGGRRTPSRLTPDAFQKGEVKDRSPDSGGGATGGGKLSGAGSEGLEGMGPRIKRDYGRLKGLQAALRNKAERINVQLKVQGYPSGGLEKAIDVMKQVEDDLDAMSKGIMRAPYRRRELLIKSMSETQRVLKGEARIIGERTSSLPDFMMDDIYKSLDDPTPKGYEDLIGEYQKRLSGAK